MVVKIDERSNRKDRALYLAANGDLATARTAVRAAVPGVVEVDGVLADQVRVRSFALEQDSVRAGGSVGLTVEWEAVGPIPLDWRQVTFLRDRSGQVVDQTERSLGGGSGGTSTWAPGPLGLPVVWPADPGEDAARRVHDRRRPVRLEGAQDGDGDGRRGPGRRRGPARDRPSPVVAFGVPDVVHGRWRARQGRPRDCGPRPVSRPGRSGPATGGRRSLAEGAAGLLVGWVESERCLVLTGGGLPGL